MGYIKKFFQNRAREKIDSDTYYTENCTIILNTARSAVEIAVPKIRENWKNSVQDESFPQEKRDAISNLQHETLNSFIKAGGTREQFDRLHQAVLFSGEYNLYQRAHPDRLPA